MTEEKKNEAVAEEAKAKPAKKAPAKKAEAKKAAPKKEKKAEPKKSGKVVANPDLYDTLVRPIVTEKTTAASEHNKVVFEISPRANKTEVKEAVEQLFGVKVVKVNTIHINGKTKRFRGRKGTRNDLRKAMVTLADGQSIDIAAGLK